MSHQSKSNWVSSSVYAAGGGVVYELAVVCPVGSWHAVVHHMLLATHL